MKTIPFVKLVGAGNDFILVDGRHRSKGDSPAGGHPTRWSVPRRTVPDLPEMARRWCDRKRGIGADGLLWVAPSRRGDARMRIFNPDGSEASMCGNGLRCLVWYLHSKDHGRKSLAVETGSGLLQSQVVGRERVRLFVSTPKNLKLGIPLTIRGTRYPLHFVDTGVPHAVLKVSSLDRFDLAALGPAIRFHRIFKPAGTNVNLLWVEDRHRISIRTYERGVEAETLACGTGAVASAVIGTALRFLEPPIRVKTTSGEELTVGFRHDRKPWEGLYLEGPARILFEGVLKG